MKSNSFNRHWIETLEPREFMSVTQITPEEVESKTDSSDSPTDRAAGSPIFAEFQQVRRSPSTRIAGSPPDPRSTPSAFAALEAKLAEIHAASSYGLGGRQR